MKRTLGFLLLAFSFVCSAQTVQIKSGSTVFIEPMAGYETYLAAAFTKKQVPLILVTDKTKADYVIMSTVSRHEPSQPAVVVNNTNTVNGSRPSGSGGFPMRGYGADSENTSASVSVVDVRSSQIVFAYAADSARASQLQSTAEACAKHLKEFIEKKPKK